MSPGRAPRWLPQRPEAIRNLTIDAMTGRVVTALRDAGVPSLLLKGPVIARRLYSGEEVRPYADCDLLVRRADLPAAEATVAALGLSRQTDWEQVSPDWERHHSQWRLAEREFDLELHWTLVHMGADPDTVWEVCRRDRQTLVVAGVALSVPPDPQLALHLSLHAAQHGVSWARPQEDLSRAVRSFDLAVWREAAARARELDAVPGFAAGLRLIPDGAALAARLALPDAPSFDVLLTTGAVGGLALDVDRFLRAPGLGARVRLISRTAFPPPAVIRSKHLAGGGGRDLPRGYVLQWLDAARRLARGLRARRRTRRQLRRR